MEAADRLVDRGLGAALSAVRRARRRAAAVARRHRHAGPKELLARVRAELERCEPALARVLSAATLAAWVAAARGPAREASAEPDPDAPPPPARPLQPAPAGAGDEPPVRWPAVEAAVRDLLARGVVTVKRVERLERQAADAGADVARALVGDAAGAVRDAVVEELKHGGGLKEFARSAGEVLEAAGFSDSQVETVFRTQTALARSAGLRAVLDTETVGDQFPYQRYVCVHDGRVRPDHAALERLGIGGGPIYRCDDPVARKYFPPWGFNCRCVAIPLSIEDAAAAGIPEAREWARTGEPPSRPAWVDDPGFPLPKGWPARDGQIRPAV